MSEQQNDAADQIREGLDKVFDVALSTGNMVGESLIEHQSSKEVTDSSYQLRQLRAERNQTRTDNKSAAEQQTAQDKFAAALYQHEIKTCERYVQTKKQSDVVLKDIDAKIALNDTTQPVSLTDQEITFLTECVPWSVLKKYHITPNTLILNDAQEAITLGQHRPPLERHSDPKANEKFAADHDKILGLNKQKKTDLPTNHPPSPSPTPTPDTKTDAQPNPTAKPETPEDSQAKVTTTPTSESEDFGDAEPDTVSQMEDSARDRYNNSFTGEPSDVTPTNVADNNKSSPHIISPQDGNSATTEEGDDYKNPADSLTPFEEIKQRIEQQKDQQYRSNQTQLDKDLTEIEEAIRSLTAELKTKGIGETALRDADVVRTFGPDAAAIENLVAKGGLPDLTSADPHAVVTSEAALRRYPELALELADYQHRLLQLADTVPADIIDQHFSTFSSRFADSVDQAAHQLHQQVNNTEVQLINIDEELAHANQAFDQDLMVTLHGEKSKLKQQLQDLLPPLDTISPLQPSTPPETSPAPTVSPLSPAPTPAESFADTAPLPPNPTNPNPAETTPPPGTPASPDIAAPTPPPPSESAPDPTTPDQKVLTIFGYDDLDRYATDMARADLREPFVKTSKKLFRELWDSWTKGKENRLSHFIEHSWLKNVFLLKHKEFAVKELSVSGHLLARESILKARQEAAHKYYDEYTDDQRRDARNRVLDTRNNTLWNRLQRHVNNEGLRDSTLDHAAINDLELDILKGMRERGEIVEANLERDMQHAVEERFNQDVDRVFADFVHAKAGESLAILAPDHLLAQKIRQKTFMYVQDRIMTAEILRQQVLTDIMDTYPPNDASDAAKTAREIVESQFFASSLKELGDRYRTEIDHGRGFANIQADLDATEIRLGVAAPGKRSESEILVGERVMAKLEKLGIHPATAAIAASMVAYTADLLGYSPSASYIRSQANRALFTAGLVAAGPLIGAPTAVPLLVGAGTFAVTKGITTYIDSKAGVQRELRRRESDGNQPLIKPEMQGFFGKLVGGWESLKDTQVGRFVIGETERTFLNRVSETIPRRSATDLISSFTPYYEDVHAPAPQLRPLSETDIRGALDALSTAKAYVEVSDLQNRTPGGVGIVTYAENRREDLQRTQLDLAMSRFRQDLLDQIGDSTAATYDATADEYLEALTHLKVGELNSTSLRRPLNRIERLLLDAHPEDTVAEALTKAEHGAQVKIIKRSIEGGVRAGLRAGLTGWVIMEAGSLSDKVTDLRSNLFPSHFTPLQKIFSHQNGINHTQVHNAIQPNPVPEVYSNSAGLPNHGLRLPIGSVLQDTNGDGKLDLTLPDGRIISGFADQNHNVLLTPEQLTAEHLSRTDGALPFTDGAPQTFTHLGSGRQLTLPGQNWQYDEASNTLKVGLTNLHRSTPFELPNALDSSGHLTPAAVTALKNMGINVSETPISGTVATTINTFTAADGHTIDIHAFTPAGTHLEAVIGHPGDFNLVSDVTHHPLVSNLHFDEHGAPTVTSETQAQLDAAHFKWETNSLAPVSLFEPGVTTPDGHLSVLETYGEKGNLFHREGWLDNLTEKPDKSELGLTLFVRDGQVHITQSLAHNPNGTLFPDRINLQAESDQGHMAAIFSSGREGDHTGWTTDTAGHQVASGWVGKIVPMHSTADGHAEVVIDPNDPQYSALFARNPDGSLLINDQGELVLTTKFIEVGVQTGDNFTDGQPGYDIVATETFAAHEVVPLLPITPTELHINATDPVIGTATFPVIDIGIAEFTTTTTTPAEILFPVAVPFNLPEIPLAAEKPTTPNPLPTPEITVPRTSLPAIKEEFKLYHYGKEPDFNLYRSRRSPRLTLDPNAKLDLNQESEWFFSQQSPEYNARIRTLASQTEPMNDKVRAVVCMPVAAHQEENAIYNTLTRYLNQQDMNGNPLDPETFEIFIYLNKPNTKPGDGTESEIQRFKRDCPNIAVRVIKEELEPKDVLWGKIVGAMNDTILYRAHQRTNPQTSDFVMLTNDADMTAISPIYISSFVDELSKPENNHVDGILGKLEWSTEAYDQYPVFHAATRFWQYVDNITRHGTSDEDGAIRPNIGSPGATFGIRASTYAGIGGYYQETGAGADQELSWMIKAARSKDGELDLTQQNYPIKMLNKAWLESSPRRGLDYYLKGKPIVTQWADWDKRAKTEDPARERHYQELLSHGESLENFNTDRLQMEINALLDLYGYDGNTPVVEKALHLMGVQFENDGNKIRITNTDKLIQNLRDFRDKNYSQIKKQNNQTPASIS